MMQQSTEWFNMERTLSDGAMYKEFLIRNDEDHARALHRVETLWDAPEGSPEADELELLGIVIDAYERRRWPVSAAG